MAVSDSFANRPVTLSYYLLSRNLDFLMDFPLLFCILVFFLLTPKGPNYLGHLLDTLSQTASVTFDTFSGV